MFTKKVQYDKLAVALDTGAAAIATFEDVVADLEEANGLLAEVELEEKVKAQAAADKASQASAARAQNTIVADRIRALVAPEAEERPEDLF